MGLVAVAGPVFEFERNLMILMKLPELLQFEPGGPD
jgi:hypothetical protein